MTKRLNEFTEQEIFFTLKSTSSHHPTRSNDIHIESGKDSIVIHLSCDLDFVMQLLTTDIVKSDVKKVKIKKGDLYKDHYQADYVLKQNPNKIVSYSFFTDNKKLLNQFVENVTVKSMPTGQIDVPTNKKLVKLNRKAIKKINHL